MRSPCLTTVAVVSRGVPRLGSPCLSATPPLRPGGSSSLNPGFEGTPVGRPLPSSVRNPLPPCRSPPLIVPQGGVGDRHLVNPKFFVAAHCVVVWVTVLWGTATCIPCTHGGTFCLLSLKWNLTAQPCFPPFCMDVPCPYGEVWTSPGRLGRRRAWQSPTAEPGFRLSHSSLHARSATAVICGIIVEWDSSEPVCMQ